MKKIFVIIFLITSLLYITGCQSQTKAVAIGDSITYGLPYGPEGSWVHFANNSKQTIINKGVNGETTYQMLSRFTEDVVKNKPDYVIITGGTNDAFYDVSPEEVTKNISTMIELANKNNIIPILGLPLPINDPIYEKKLQNYRSSMIKLANHNKLKTLDFYKSLLDPDTGYLNKSYDFDGVHPNLGGYMKMSQIVKLEK